MTEDKPEFCPIHNTPLEIRYEQGPAEFDGDGNMIGEPENIPTTYCPQCELENPKTKELIIQEAKEYIDNLFDQANVDPDFYFDIDEFAYHWSGCLGYSSLMLEPVLLEVISDCLGRFTEADSFSPVDPRPNIFLGLSAMPDFFHKTTLMNVAENLSKAFQSMMEDLKVEIKPTAYLTFDGSVEGLQKSLEEIRVVHYSVDEFKNLIDLNRKNGRYDAGRAILLVQIYDGRGFIQTLKNKKGNYVPPGYYATLITTMHPGDINADTLQIGLLRRMWIVKLTKEDMVDDSIAFRKEVSELSHKFQFVFFKRILNLGISLSEDMEFIEAKEGQAESLLPIQISFNPEVRRMIESIRANAIMARIRGDSYYSKPEEDPHILLKVAMNFCLIDGKRTVSSTHLEKAINIIKETTKNYLDELENIEAKTLDYDERAEKLMRTIDKLYREKKKPLAGVKLKELNKVRTINAEARESILQRLYKQRDIFGFQVHGKAGPPHILIYPDSAPFEDIKRSLENLKENGDITNYSEYTFSKYR